MIEDILAKIETAIAQLEATDAAKKSEVLRLLAALKEEALRAKRSERLAPSVLDELAQTAKQFEASHPRLAEAIAELCRDLASLGI